MGRALSAEEWAYSSVRSWMVLMTLKGGGEKVFACEGERSIDAYLAGFRYAETQGLEVMRFEVKDVTVSL